MQFIVVVLVKHQQYLYINNILIFSTSLLFSLLFTKQVAYNHHFIKHQELKIKTVFKWKTIFFAISIIAYHLTVKTFCNNFKMSQLQNSIKIQVRVTICTLQKTAAPILYSFVLVKDQIFSQYSPWKTAQKGVVNCNSFLRIEVPEYLHNNKCMLQMYCMRDGQKSSLGHASLPLSIDKCNKVRKYPVKNRGGIIAYVSASIHLFNFDNTLPNQDIKHSQQQPSINNLYSLNSQKFDNLQFGNFGLKQQLNLETTKDKKRQRFAIKNQMSIEINQNPLNKVNADALIIRLFEGISKKKDEIIKRQTQLKEKDTEIQHIRMKQHILQQKQKKIHELKDKTTLLIQTNNQLINKDNRYDEEYFLMKQQKQLMEQQMATINSQASLKLMCLQTQLQNTKNKLQNRENKVSQLINQVESCSKQLNLLKIENKQKLNIMKSLRHELQVQNKELNPHQKYDLSDILSLLAQHFEKQNPLPSFAPHLSSQHKEQYLDPSMKKCKSLFLSKPNNQGDPIRVKQKFRQDKKSNKDNIPIPTIIESILLAANKQNMSKLLL